MSVITLSVDPATHGCGLALWRGGELVAAGYAPNTTEGTGVASTVAAAQVAVVWANSLEHRKSVAPCTPCNTTGDLFVPYGDGACPYCGGTGTSVGRLPVDQLVVELPQVYQRGANKSKGDPNKNVLPLAMVDAALAALLPDARVSEYQPHAWKGGTQKPKRASEDYVIHNRVVSRLLPEEAARVAWPKSKERCWDVDDAVAVGLHHMGRFEAYKRFARE